MLSFLRGILEKADAAGKPITVCGEMAGQPLDAMALMALGFRRLSMNPAGIGPVKSMVRSLDLAQAQEYILTLLHLPDHSLRRKLRSFAKDCGVVL